MLYTVKWTTHPFAFSQHVDGTGISITRWRLLLLRVTLLVDESSNLDCLWVAVGGHALSPRWQLELLGGHELEDLVGNDQGVEQVHATLRLLVQDVPHGQTHNVSGEGDLNLLPQLFVSDEFLAI